MNALAKAMLQGAINMAREDRQSSLLETLVVLRNELEASADSAVPVVSGAPLLDGPTARALSATAHAFRAFARNGRWGTCSSCPRDSAGQAYPEFCQHTTRGDHYLDAAGLAGAFESHKR